MGNRSDYKRIFNVVCALSLGTLAFSGCSKQNASLNPGPVGSKQDVVVEPPSGWIRRESVSEDRTVSVIESRITASQLALERNQYRRVNLIQLPVDNKYNANVFKMTDGTIEEYSNKVFIAPKLFSYGSQQGGRLAPIQNPDHTVTLSFNVAFVDGSVKEIQSPSGDQKLITLPNTFVIQEQDKLLQELALNYHATNGLAVLPGCPKKITLEANGKSYDATPPDFASGDFCQINIPTTVSLTVTAEEAKNILREGLYNGTVDVRGTYETKASIPVSKVQISFDRAQIFSDLRSELGIKTTFLNADVNIAITKAMKKQMIKVSIQGDQSALLASLVERATNEFFEKLIPNPVTGIKPCDGDAPVCFRFNYTQQEQGSKFQMDWIQETNQLVGQNYITSTKLKATPNKVTIGKEANCTNDCGRVMNNGEPRSTGLTVVSGSTIILEPDYAVKSSHEIQYSDAVMVSHNVCTSTYEVCNHERECHGRSCLNVDFLKQFQSCHLECNKVENHWEKVKNYSLGQTKQIVIQNPASNLGKFYEEIYFNFAWTDATTKQPKQLECPISVFPREGNGQNMRIKLQNVAVCSPFSNLKNEAPELSIVSHLNFAEEYLEGRSIEQWDGTFTELPVKKIYNPKIEFSATITIEDYWLMSADSKMQWIK